MGQIQTGIVDTIYKYFRTTSAGKMMFHLLWIFCILLMLSMSYIITFHFQPVIELLNHAHSLDHFRTELSTTIAVDTDTNNELNTLVQATNSQRAYVFRYHNGIPSVNSVPFMFHTNTHEVIRAGANRAIVFSQRLPTSIMYMQNAEFLKRKCVTLRDLDRNPDSNNYWYYQQRNAVAMVRCPFLSPRGDLLGFVGVDYVDRPSAETLRAAESAVSSTSDHIGRIFENRGR